MTNEAMRSILSRAEPESEQDILAFDLNLAQQGAPSTIQWKVLDHCAAVGRIYAIFEQYCEAVLADWIAFRVRGCRLVELPDRMSAAYASGVMAVIGSISQIRYSHLSTAQIIAEYNKALSGNNDFSIPAECLTHHRNNLRLPDVIELLERCGLESCDAWLANHPILIAHFQTPNKIFEQTGSKLVTFVQYRNDAAHGVVDIDEILGIEQINEYIDFIKSLVQVIDEFICLNVIERLLQINMASHIGSVTKTFSENVVIGNLEGATLKIGDTIYLSNKKSCVARKIESIMLNDEELEIVVIANPAEVGLKLNFLPLKKSKIFYIDSDYVF